MSASEDVKTLFRRFGGQPETYHEVIRDQQRSQSLGKWAMLGQVDLSHPQAIPAVHRAVPTLASRPSTEVDHPSTESVAARPAAPAPRVQSAVSAAVDAPSRPALQATATAFAPKRAVEAAPQVTTPAAPVAAAGRPFTGRTVPNAGPAQPASAPRPLATPTSSPLASRLKSRLAPALDDAVNAPAPQAQSLVSLFGRLAAPPAAGAGVGVLRRRLNP